MLQVAGAGATNGTTTTPAFGVGRVIVDPNNTAVAYIAFVGSNAGTSHVWKTTNLNALPGGSVTWTAMSTGLPDVAANAFAIDPDSAPPGGFSQSLYVGTDAGVYHSADGGATWNVYGTGMPHVSTFALEMQNPNAILRAAPHGRGIYDIPAALELVNAASRKTHGAAGTFDIALPLIGSVGVEDRSDGTGNYTIVLRLTNPVIAGSASVTGHNPSGSGTVSSVSFSGNEMLINLTGVTNAQILTVTATGVTDINGQTIASVGVDAGFLTGDTNADHTVNSADVSQTKSQSGTSVTSSNFREDVTIDGTINSADVSLVKARSGTAIP